MSLYKFFTHIMIIRTFIKSYSKTGRNAWALPARHHGFSLVELLVAVSIVGILVTVAVPSYRDHVIRGEIPEATANLSAKQIQMEQWFQDNRTFIGAPACNADTTTSQYFNFSCTGLAATTYTLQAVGKGSMAGFGFTINQSNAKTTSAVPAGWSAHSPNTCWVTKRGGIC